MGMTIEDTINSFQYFRNHPITDDKEVIKQGQELLDTAIDTMRKYQKISEIVKQKDYDRFNSHNYYGYFLRVQDIRKVLEDGNNN